jgi:tRNA (guanine-N7-)-methyltransferase
MKPQRAFAANQVPRPLMTPMPHAWREFTHLDLEIGAGNGKFAEAYCIQHPHRALISIERTLLRSQALLSRSLPNLFAYRADVVNFVTHFLTDESLERIFILYPNPYPKAKQANLRWYNMPFMEFLLRRLKPGGQLTLATNILSYKNEAIQVMTKQWDLRLVTSSPFIGEPRTAFERKYLNRGEVCWNLVFSKKL